MDSSRSLSVARVWSYKGRANRLEWVLGKRGFGKEQGLSAGFIKEEKGTRNIEGNAGYNPLGSKYHVEIDGAMRQNNIASKNGNICACRSTSQLVCPATWAYASPEEHSPNRSSFLFPDLSRPCL